MTSGEQEPQEGEERAGEPVAPSPGGISIGVLTGGAVAAGEGASAEDRSRRSGRPEPPAAPPEVPRANPGGIAIGAMTAGAVAAGPNAKALDASEQSVGVPPELRTAMRTLREQLSLLSPSDETSELDARLAEAEEEAGATGQVRCDRLQWLRERLDLGSTAAAGLASAAAVVQQITQLLGSQGWPA
ncbi:hypothetical protein OG429_30130 [Streptomyces sp. NBC_00190]|uniref:hypothetical protein n=1 Tax=unclassified Streptomyces TaxID=2593676 RepID=UPI002E2B110A|nr:hypothetical protein [Streptomyces sp. NBC_00190]WSZ43172.1 hypothetical protein OG239_32745 [Streptomyces sp. NBC_00868]